MIKNSIREISNPVTLLLCIFVFFLPLEQLYSVITIFGIILSYLFSGGIKKSFQHLRKNRPLQLSCLFYLLHVTGIFYTSNYKYGFDDLQTKLVFILFPLVISGFDIHNQRFTIIRRSFIAGCLTSCLLFISLSINTYMHEGDLQVFFYKGISHWFHPTYLSLYFNIALLFVCTELFKVRKFASGILLSLIFLILLLTILLLSSRTATAVTYLTILIYPILFYGRKILKGQALAGYLSTFVFMIFLFVWILNFNNRYKQVETVIEQYTPRTDQSANKVNEAEEDNSTNTRIKIWSYSADLIKRNALIGVGTGDVRDELEQIFLEKNYTFGAIKHLNAHNQFLNTGVALGVIGFFVLLLLFILPGMSAIKRKNWVYVLFLSAFFLNCLTESVLERQVGILCFCIFFTLFSLNMSNTEKAPG